jgi:hypothetical protein
LPKKKKKERKVSFFLEYARDIKFRYHRNPYMYEKEFYIRYGKARKHSPNHILFTDK